MKQSLFALLQDSKWLRFVSYSRSFIRYDLQHHAFACLNVAFSSRIQGKSITIGLLELIQIGRGKKTRRSIVRASIWWCGVVGARWLRLFGHVLVNVCTEYRCVAQIDITDGTTLLMTQDTSSQSSYYQCWVSEIDKLMTDHNWSNLMWNNEHQALD